METLLEVNYEPAKSSKSLYGFSKGRSVEDSLKEIRYYSIIHVPIFALQKFEFKFKRGKSGNKSSKKRTLTKRVDRNRAESKAGSSVRERCLSLLDK